MVPDLVCVTPKEDRTVHTWLGFTNYYSMPEAKCTAPGENFVPSSNTD